MAATAVAAPALPPPAPAVVVAPSNGDGAAPPAEGGVFESPEAAMLAIASAAEAGDFDRIKAIFWRDCEDMIEPQDERDDEDDCVHVAAMIRERLAFDDLDGGLRKVAVIGKDAWRFPIPLFRMDRAWVFDLAEGQERILTIEIGRNELLTIGALEEYADAQREYSFGTGDGKPRGYARRFRSTDGRRDGLHWPTRDGEKQSPLGPLFARAANESIEGPPAAFNGYRYKMLKDGCRFPSSVESRPSVGCAALAWPAVYGITGITTFMVNQAGIVFEKDLGPDTEKIVSSLSAFEPDDSWKPSRATLREAGP